MIDWLSRECSYTDTQTYWLRPVGDLPFRTTKHQLPHVVSVRVRARANEVSRTRCRVHGRRLRRDELMTRSTLNPDPP